MRIILRMPLRIEGIFDFGRSLMTHLALSVSWEPNTGDQYQLHKRFEPNK